MLNLVKAIGRFSHFCMEINPLKTLTSTELRHVLDLLRNCLFGCVDMTVHCSTECGGRGFLSVYWCWNSEYRDSAYLKANLNKSFCIAAVQRASFLGRRFSRRISIASFSWGRLDGQQMNYNYKSYEPRITNLTASLPSRSSWYLLNWSYSKSATDVSPELYTYFLYRTPWLNSRMIPC